MSRVEVAVTVNIIKEGFLYMYMYVSVAKLRPMMRRVFTSFGKVAHSAQAFPSAGKNGGKNKSRVKLLM